MSLIKEAARIARQPKLRKNISFLTTDCSITGKVTIKVLTFSPASSGSNNNVSGATNLLWPLLNGDQSQIEAEQNCLKHIHTRAEWSEYKRTSQKLPYPLPKPATALLLQALVLSTFVGPTALLLWCDGALLCSDRQQGPAEAGICAGAIERTGADHEKGRACALTYTPWNTYTLCIRADRQPV